MWTSSRARSSAAAELEPNTAERGALACSKLLQAALSAPFIHSFFSCGWAEAQLPFTAVASLAMLLLASSYSMQSFYSILTNN